MKSRAFAAYLGKDREAWRAFDVSALIQQAAERLPILIDQGEADEFLDRQLQQWRLARAAEAVGYPLQLRLQAGHDYSHYFIASFIGEHIGHHAAALRA